MENKRKKYYDRLEWYERDNRLRSGVLKEIVRNLSTPTDEQLRLWRLRAIELGLPKQYVDEIVEYLK